MSGSHESGEESDQEFTRDLGNPLSDYQLPRNRTKREIIEPVRMNNYLSLVVLSYKELAFEEPNSYKEAISCQHLKERKLAMEEEIESLIKNNTWELVPKSKNKSIVDCK